MQRKQYRIESLLASRRLPATANDLGPLAQDGESGRLARGAAELAAAMEAMEKACGLVLGTAERVDDTARRLAAAAEGADARALARDIRAQMARVYELCNFQDIAGQRITKVIALLSGLDEPLSDEASAASSGSTASGLVNGPRLDGASGHVSQHDVDALFG